jgi:hypothetical protein
VFIGLEAVTVRCTFIRSSTIDGDTRVAGTDVVLLAVVIRDAFVVGVSLNDDALELSITCEVFIWIDTILSAQTFVIPFTGDGNTDVLRVADEVFVGVAFVALSAFIRSLSVHNGAKISDTFKVLIILKTVGISSTFIIPCSIDGDTRVTLADVVLLAVVVGDTFVGGVALHDDAGGRGGAGEVLAEIKTVFPAEAFVIPFTGKGDADVLTVAGEVLSRIAFVALRAFILSSSVDDDAEVSDTCEVFIGFETITIRRAFIISCSIDGDAGVALADVVLLGIVATVITSTIQV